MYLIYPDADLCFSEAAAVIACIFVFVAVLCYLGSNQLQFRPNYAMFVNYLFGIDDSKGFVRLIKSIVGDHLQSEDQRIQTDATKKTANPKREGGKNDGEIFVYDGAKRRQMPESAQRKAERQFDKDFAKQEEGQALIRIEEELRTQLTRPSSEIDWDYIRKNFRYLAPSDKKTAEARYNAMMEQKMRETQPQPQPQPQQDGFTQQDTTSNIVNRLISKSMLSGNKVSLRL